ncbi:MULTISPECIES: glyoxalase/bleomycin resistance/dioxygenase family protein [Bacteroides]|uniref:VOC family protein n=1 Tax=Bacteroides TaxID=816 RepID=UPI0004B0BD7D|nr:glyoxalase/bleomycin resistance/dioxygenase family protein [Bacteroides neonati]MCP3894355.1 glyoxalase/bleomycin resistance/dioxygenase family protein [Bacteroides sp.]
MRTIDHIGIPTTEPKAGEVYVEGMKVFLTNYADSTNRIEWLRFESDSWMPKLIQERTHIAYQVTDPEAEMEGKNILLPPTDLGGGAWIAFIEEEGIAIELMWNQ